MSDDISRSRALKFVAPAPARFVPELVRTEPSTSTPESNDAARRIAKLDLVGLRDGWCLRGRKALFINEIRLRAIASRGVVDFGSRVVHALRSTSHLER